MLSEGGEGVERELECMRDEAACILLYRIAKARGFDTFRVVRGGCGEHLHVEPRSAWRRELRES